MSLKKCSHSFESESESESEIEIGQGSLLVPAQPFAKPIPEIERLSIKSKIFILMSLFKNLTVII